jgi:hypothetical protein
LIGDAVVIGAPTVTVALAVAVPPPPCTVIVKVFVLPGDTWKFPFKATLPTPVSIAAETPLFEVHERVAIWPAPIVVGVTLMLTVGGGGLLTSTLKVELIVPPAPVAVAV